jgi:hypothetical protein
MHLNPVSGIPNAVIEEIESESPGVALSPATMGSSDTAKFKLPLVYEIRLYNTLGTPVHQTVIDGETPQTQLPAGNLPNGIYTLHVTGNRGNPPVMQHIAISN